jgi:hypothetical protein
LASIWLVLTYENTLVWCNRIISVESSSNSWEYAKRERTKVGLWQRSYLSLMCMSCSNSDELTLTASCCVLVDCHLSDVVVQHLTPPNHLPGEIHSHKCWDRAYESGVTQTWNWKPASGRRMRNVFCAYVHHQK